MTPKHILFLPGSIFCCLAFLLFAATLSAQQTTEVNKEFARGDFINSVRIFLIDDSTRVAATPQEMEEFYDAFFIRPGTTFNPLVADLAINRIRAQGDISDAYYRLYEAQTAGGSLNPPIDLYIYVELLGEREQERGRSGLLAGDKFGNFPLLYESQGSQFKLFANGGLGVYDDFNPLFGKTAAFAEQNPIADDPSRFLQCG